MADTVERGLINKSTLTSIGDAIRAKTGSTTKYKPSEMAAAISSIKRDDIIVTTGDKYTLKVINPKNGAITSSLVGTVINNSDETVSIGLTDDSDYIPNTGYDPGIVTRSFDSSTNVYTVTGTDASPTSVIDNKGFARAYLQFYYSCYLFFNKDFSGTSTYLNEASGKIFIAGIEYKSGTYPGIGKGTTVFFDPVVSTEYSGVGYYYLSGNKLEYLSLPNCKSSSFDVSFGDNGTHLKYLDLGSVSGFKYFRNGKYENMSVILRKTDSIVPVPSLIDTKIGTLYVPSSLVSSYKNSNWKNLATNIVALEGSKYEDPYGFIDEISE